jgi:hypothetical protein
MQLKIQRSQRRSVLGAVVFCLDLRADYTPEERDDIRKYALGSQVVYRSRAARAHYGEASAHLDRVASDRVGERAAGLARGALSAVMAKLNLNVSIGSLAKGHHIECKDLEELVLAEEELRLACGDITKYLQVAATFNGSEVVIGYDKGVEVVSVTQNAPALIEYRPEPDPPEDEPPFPPPSVGSVSDMAGTFWADPTNRGTVYILGGIGALMALAGLVLH